MDLLHLVEKTQLVSVYGIGDKQPWTSPPDTQWACVCQLLVTCEISADLLSIACRYSMCRALALLAPAVAATEGSRSVA